MRESVTYGGRHIPILPTKTITTALTGDTSGTGGSSGVIGLGGATYLVFKTYFDYGSGGTTADVYYQTSLDNGTTWMDIANHSFTTADATKVSACTAYIAPASQALTPADGALTANTIVQGVIGDRLRVKITTTGTYAGSTTLKCDVWAKG